MLMKLRTIAGARKKPQAICSHTPLAFQKTAAGGAPSPGSIRVRVLLYGGMRIPPPEGSMSDFEARPEFAGGHRRFLPKRDDFHLQHEAYS